MAGEFGVENFNKTADLVYEIGNVAGKAFEDGKVTLTDAALLMGLLDEAMALTSVKWSDIPKELKELDDEDRAAMITHFEEKFDIPQDKIETYVELGVIIVNKLVSLGFEIADFVKQIKEHKEKKVVAE